MAPQGQTFGRNRGRSAKTPLLETLLRTPGRYPNQSESRRLAPGTYYVKSPPERVPGDKFLSLPWKMWWNFRKFGEWKFLSLFSLGKYQRKFATKNPPSFSRGGGGKCKISSPKSSGSGFAQGTYSFFRHFFSMRRTGNTAVRRGFVRTSVQKNVRNPQPPLLLKKSTAIRLQFVTLAQEESGKGVWQKSDRKSPWKLKPGFFNRALVAVIFEASKCL